MKPIRVTRGRLAPLDRANVDTDQIIPKQFLKRIERSGFGEFAFHDWRRDPDFAPARPEYAAASILVTGPNFGCGSSREHAAWALQDAGYAAIVAPSFADIFRSNCHNVGLLPVVLAEGEVKSLLRAATDNPETELVIDLEAQSVRGGGVEAPFEIEPFVRQRLLNGWDEIALSERHEHLIEDYERRRPQWLPKSTRWAPRPAPSLGCSHGREPDSAVPHAVGGRLAGHAEEGPRAD